MRGCKCTPEANVGPPLGTEVSNNNNNIDDGGDDDNDCNDNCNSVDDDNNGSGCNDSRCVGDKKNHCHFTNFFYFKNKYKIVLKMS